jgi:hypothetical protein
LEKYKKVEDKMSGQKITKYSVDIKCSKKVEKYLGKNSREYAFSSERGEEEYLCFSDNEKRIFAILDTKNNNLQLANYASSNIKSGIENMLKLGDKN